MPTECVSPAYEHSISILKLCKPEIHMLHRSLRPKEAVMLAGRLGTTAGASASPKSTRSAVPRRWHFKPSGVQTCAHGVIDKLIVQRASAERKTTNELCARVDLADTHPQRALSGQNSIQRHDSTTCQAEVADGLRSPYMQLHPLVHIWCSLFGSVLMFVANIP